MAVSSSSHSQNQQQCCPHLFFSSIVVILLLQLLVMYPSATPRGLLFEEKTRLGSRPPSCYNKCNQCHPCKAVQVPSPAQARVDPAPDEPGSDNKEEELDSSVAFSNYKPMGWKCMCNNHYFNP